MTLLGNIPVETVQLCKDFLNFTRCERKDGTAYGTAGKCRKGVEVERLDEEKVKRFKEALAMGTEEFNSKVYPQFDKLLKDSADGFVERVKSNKMTITDRIRLLSSQRFLTVKAAYDDLKKEDEKLALKLAKTKEFFDDIKWKGSSDLTFVSEGTLRATWDGINPAAKAKDAFQKDHPDSKFGQSKVAVGEHPHPTKVLLNQVLALKTGDGVETASFVMRRNFISWTSAIEDKRVEGMGFKATTPDENDSFSRYKVAGVKTFPLSKDFDSERGIRAKELLKNAQEARANGVSFEEWAASVTDF